MPSVSCEYCGFVFQFSKKEWRYFDHQGPFICSPCCLIDCINMSVKVPSKNYNLGIRYHHTGKIHKRFDGSVQDETNRLLQGRQLRSFYEKIVAEILAFHNIPFIYEGYTFSWGTKVYTPDFYIVGKDLFLEMKGQWGASQKSKLQSFRDSFHDYQVLIIPWAIYDQFVRYWKNHKKDLGCYTVRGE